MAALIQYEQQDKTVIVTLSSEANRNALTSDLIDQLGHALRSARDDRSVRSIILAHTGTTFCSGADLKSRSSTGEHRPPSVESVLRTIVTMPKPIIVRIDGAVRAGGMGIVGACDIAVASQRSSFSFSEVRVGVAPAIISLTTFPRMLARAVQYYALTGQVFDARSAEVCGLITRCADNVVAEADTVVEALLRCSPNALAAIKNLMNVQISASLDRDLPAMVDLSARLFQSAEAREGIEAFLERRRPKWAAKA
jgi:Enoyl-CoA hydratase/carnithine racemase